MIYVHILKHLQVHPSAYAYTTGRSIRDFASLHCGRKHILKLDLDNFFARTHRRYIERVFSHAGYPYYVGRFLTGLCTNEPPLAICRNVSSAYESAHLPQGAPTSPSLSNLCFFRLDERISDLAAHHGLQYSRYADDLVFSGNHDFNPKRVQHDVADIVSEYGHRVNGNKVRFLGRNRRQHVCNITVNEHVNCSRREFDELKAILHNCMHYGINSQNRNHHPHFSHHLKGRIEYIHHLNPNRGSKLRAMFNSIDWKDETTDLSDSTETTKQKSIYS